MNDSCTFRPLWIASGVIVCTLAIMSLPARETSAQSTAESTAASAEADATFEVPDGDAAELQAFIEKVAQSEPKGATQEEQMANMLEGLRAIRDAAAKMQVLKLDEEQTDTAFRYWLMALQGLSQLGDKADAEAYHEATDKVMADPRPEVALVGWRSHLIGLLSTWDSLSESDKQGLYDRVVAKVKGDKPTPMTANIVGSVVMELDNRAQSSGSYEASRKDVEFAAKLLSETLPILQQSDNDEVKALIDENNLEGMLRRLTLLGQPMKIEGELLGGGMIDWKAYRGKVVLVDFSATWCGPCVEEAPNVLNMYKLYNDKGFDVVAVSLDRTEEAAKEYVKANGIQWATIFPAKEEDRYWNMPLVRYYGITGIPTAILLDQKGNVVHMNARGPDLKAELEKLLGPPAETKPAEGKG
jgi:thiol-disulfide isomerase/thioredoxin